MTIALILIILGVISLVIGMTLGLKSIKPVNFNVIAGVIIVIGTFFGLFGKQLQDKSSSEKSDKILLNTAEATDRIKVLDGQNQQLQSQSKTLEEKIELQHKIIDKLREENTELYTNLATASSKIYKQVTGGDSYCVIEPNFNAVNDQLHFTLKLVGQTPLNNAQITIEDLGRRAYLIQTQANNDYKSSAANKITKETSYGWEYTSIKPNTILKLPIPLEPNQTEVRLHIWMFLDNGTVFEDLQITDLKDEAKRKILIDLKRGEESLKLN